MSLISVVIPVYNEEENIAPMIERLDEVASRAAPHEMEFIFVDDGSSDQTLPRLREAATGNARVKVVSLSRNFGSHAALRAGFAYASGRAAVNLSGDLQDPPEIILEMIHHWQDGAEIVWGVRAERDDAAGYVGFARLYYWMMRTFALKDMPAGGMDLCLMDRRVLDVLLATPEKNTTLFGLILWLGFKQVFVPYHRRARQFGRTKWSFERRVKLILDSLTSFSIAPIRVWSYVGGIVFLVGMSAMLVGVVGLVVGTEWGGPLLGISILAALLGLNLLATGIVGEYVWRAFDQIRPRPAYIVRETIGFVRAERRGTSVEERALRNER